MLVFIPRNRITAKETLKHPYITNSYQQFSIDSNCSPSTTICSISTVNDNDLSLEDHLISPVSEDDPISNSKIDKKRKCNSPAQSSSSGSSLSNSSSFNMKLRSLQQK